MKKAVISIAISAFTGMVLPAWAQVGVDYRGAWVLSPVSPSDAQMLRKEHDIHTVFAMRASDDHIFDDSSLFSELRQVALTVDEHNLNNLKVLSKSYPQLTCITISQKQPLSDEAIEYLNSFKQLESLELSCPIATPFLLTGALPEGIEQLEIRNSNVTGQEGLLPESQLSPTIAANNGKLSAQLAISNNDGVSKWNLPCLKELTIERGRLKAEFLEKISAPNLRRLCLFGVEVESGALRHLDQFPELHELNLAGSSVLSEEYQAFDSRHLIVIEPGNTRHVVHGGTRK